MRSFVQSSLSIILIFILAGCSDKMSNSTNITIEPYSLSEKERLLISKTGVEHIEYFKLNGTLSEDDDIQLSVEVYEQGTFKEELLKTYGDIEKNHKDSLLSFGVSDFNDENRPLKLIAGIPAGLASTSYSSAMTSFSFSSLVNEKITVEKNKPVYLAAWQGTTKNELRAGVDGDGELPEGIDEAELVFLYKFVWTNQDEN